MHLLRFLIRARDDLGGAVEVVPVVDDVPLPELVERFERAAVMDPPGGYGGLVPELFRLGSLEAHFAGRSEGALRPERFELLGCSCGEVGCWPLVARITCTPCMVCWDDFQQPHRRTRDYAAFGPFTFARDAYDDALAELVRSIAATR